MNTEPIEIPADADVKVLHQILAHTNAVWAQRDPHRAMQIHVGCQVGQCVAKTVGWGELVRLGVIIPDSSESLGIHVERPEDKAANS